MLCYYRHARRQLQRPTYRHFDSTITRTLGEGGGENNEIDR